MNLRLLVKHMNLLRFPLRISTPDIIFKRGASNRVNGNTSVKVAAAVFDPTANSGERTIAAHNLGVYIPDNAIITKCWYDVITTFTTASTDAGTLALKVQGANDLVSAIAVSDGTNVWDAGVHGSLLGYPNLGADAAHDSSIEVAALFAGVMLKTTAERQLVATIAVQVFLTGKLVLYVEYVMGS